MSRATHGTHDSRSGTVRERVGGGSGRVKEYMKIALRDVLNRRNVDLVRYPFPARVVATATWLGLDTVVDVGANIGQYGSALRASGFRGRIVSCEPLPDAYRHLARRCASDRSWSALNTAVGAAPGQLEINVSANSYSSSILPMTSAHRTAAPGSEFVRTEQVAVTTVEALVADLDLVPERTLLKIDTQGFESRVLDGAGPLLGRFAALQLELSYVPLYDGQDLADVLRRRVSEAGFVEHGFDAGFADPRTGRMLQGDGLFVRADLAERATTDVP